MKRAFQTLLATMVCVAVVGGCMTAWSADVRDDKATNAHRHRASKIIGMSVHNAAGEKIGKIDDLVIRTGDGQISYAAVGFGGFLGFGEKLFAVPFNQLKFQSNSNDSYFDLHVAKEKLQNAPGFDKNNWPDMADPNWSRDIDNYYTTTDTTAKPNATTDPLQGQKVPNMVTYRASKLVGMSVRNDQNERVGTIDDLVINMDNGQIAYAALGFGGVLGLGEKLFAVPFNQFKFDNDKNDPHFVLNVSRDRLKAAPGFDKNHWPDLADPNWSQAVDKYYRTEQKTTTTTVTTSDKN